MLLRRHFYFFRSCPLMCIWYVWGYCENKVPIEGCQSVEWWHIFCVCSGRLVSISACEEQEQDEMKQVKQSRAARAQGSRVLRSQVCWASQFLALHLVCGELCKVVVRWKGRVYRRIWMSACTQHHSWAGHGGLHMWTQHSGGWSRRSTWAIQSNIGSNIKQMLTPKNCCVSEDHVELSRGNNKIYTYLAM